MQKLTINPVKTPVMISIPVWALRNNLELMTKPDIRIKVNIG